MLYNYIMLYIKCVYIGISGCFNVYVCIYVYKHIYTHAYIFAVQYLLLNFTLECYCN